MLPHASLARPLSRRPWALLFTASLAFAGSAEAQASALLREGDAPAGAPAGQVVTALNNSAVNGVGGFAVSLSTNDGVTTLSHVWGTADGSAPALLRTETTVGNLAQNSFESFLGFDDAGVAVYSASCDDLVGGGTSLDSVFADDLVVALEDEVISSLPGKVWRFASRPGVTQDGQPYWVGGINDEGTGANEGNGLFLGVGAVPLAKTGDIIPPLTDPLSSSAIDFDARVSEGGSSWITKVTTDGTSTSDEYVVLNGSVYSIGGDLVGEGTLVPLSVGGDGLEAWDNFDFFGVNEAGDVLFTGDTDGDTSSDEFLALNGQILLREGDAVDGRVLTGTIEGAFLNAAGSIAYAWDVEDGSGGSLEAVGIDDKILLVEGDEVDWDGDGFVDAGHLLTDITGISSLTLGSEPALYFTADVDVPGVGELEALLCIAYPCMKADRWSISMSTGGSQNLDLDAGTANAGAFYGVVGTMSGTDPGFTFGGVTIPANFDAYFQQTLTQANSANFVNTFGVLDSEGRASASIVVPAEPAFVGLSAQHAFVTFTVGPLQLGKAGGPISLVLVP